MPEIDRKANNIPAAEYIDDIVCKSFQRFNSELP